MSDVRTLPVVTGAYVEYDNGRLLTICYHLNDVELGGTKGHQLRVTIDYAAPKGTRADMALGPYSIAVRVGTIEDEADIAVEVLRPGKKPLRFFLERSHFEIELTELECEIAEMLPSDAASPPSPL